MSPRKSKVPPPTSKTLSYEELLSVERGKVVSEMRFGSPPPPVNYSYEVGDAVRLGSLLDSRVESIEKNGFIHISFSNSFRSRDGFTVELPRAPRIVPWNKLEPLKDITDTAFAHKGWKNPGFFMSDISGFLYLCYQRGVRANPEYQRGYVWDQNDKRKLIESIFNGNDIGRFVIVSHPYPEIKVEIVDGKQRLRTIMDFVEGRLEYQGKTWFQLSQSDKKCVENLRVQYCEIQSSRVKKSDILWLFLQINQGGVPQTEEHVAHARELYRKAKEEENETTSTH